MSPADRHLTAPNVAGLPGLCENFCPTAFKSYPNLTCLLSSLWATSPIALSGLVGVGQRWRQLMPAKLTPAYNI